MFNSDDMLEMEGVQSELYFFRAFIGIIRCGNNKICIDYGILLFVRWHVGFYDVRIG